MRPVHRGEANFPSVSDHDTIPTAPHHQRTTSTSARSCRSLTILSLSCYSQLNARSEVHSACGNSSSPKRRVTCRLQNGTDRILPLIPVSVVPTLLLSRRPLLPSLPWLTTGAEVITGTMARLLPNVPGDLSVSVKSSEVRSPVSSTT